MTPSGGRLSENGKLIAMCLLFPLFWPFLPAVLIVMGIERLRDVYWAWSYRRRERREDAAMAATLDMSEPDAGSWEEVKAKLGL